MAKILTLKNYRETTIPLRFGNDYSTTVWIGQGNNCSKDQDNKSAKRKCEDETPLCLLVLRPSDPSLGQNQSRGAHNLPKENELRAQSDRCSLENLELLDLGSSQVRDLTPLAHLRKLKHLGLSNTRVSDLAPLAGAARRRNEP